MLELTVDKSSAQAAVIKRTLAREAEESPLLEAVPRERLMTQQAGERLSECCCDL
jgi:hypothetical protein